MLAAEVPLDTGAAAAVAAAAVPSPADMFAHTLELEAYQRELEAQQRRQLKEQQRLEREAQRLSLHGGAEAVARSGAGGGYVAPGPALEVTVMRVVGCDMLTNGLTGRDFTVATYCGSAGGAGVGHAGQHRFLLCAPAAAADSSCWQSLVDGRCMLLCHTHACSPKPPFRCRPFRRRRARLHQDWQRRQRARPGAALQPAARL